MCAALHVARAGLPCGGAPHPGLAAASLLTTATRYRRYSLLAPADLAACACTHRAWRAAVDAEEPAWRALCDADFCLTGTPLGPDRQPLPGFKAAYSAWRASFGKYGPLATRALRAWHQAEGWLAQHFPDVAASLRYGAAVVPGEGPCVGVWLPRCFPCRKLQGQPYQLVDQCGASAICGPSTRNSHPAVTPYLLFPAGPVPRRPHWTRRSTR